MKTHGLVSPKGQTGTKISLDLDRAPSATALLSPKYTKKPLIPAPAVKPPPEPPVKLIDAKVCLEGIIIMGL